MKLVKIDNNPISGLRFLVDESKNKSKKWKTIGIKKNLDQKMDISNKKTVPKL